MKKVLLFSILNLAVGITSSQAQGYVILDNYNSSLHPLVTYGPSSGGTLGAGIEAGFTVGVYFGEGAFASSVAADPSGVAIPTSLHPSLLLGTGPNTTILAYTSAFNTPGMFSSHGPFQVNSISAGTSTFVVVAYNGADYASSTIRGHSAAFEVVTYSGTGLPKLLGDYMSTFSVMGIPEPSTLTLVGLGLASLLVARRQK
jgi:hypothetical protein